MAHASATNLRNMVALYFVYIFYGIFEFLPGIAERLSRASVACQKKNDFHQHASAVNRHANVVCTTKIYILLTCFRVNLCVNCALHA